MKLIELFSLIGICLLLYSCSSAESYHYAQAQYYTALAKYQAENKIEFSFIDSGGNPVTMKVPMQMNYPKLEQAKDTDWTAIAKAVIYGGVGAYGINQIFGFANGAVSAIASSAGGGNIIMDEGSSMQMTDSQKTAGNDLTTAGQDLRRDTITKITETNESYNENKPTSEEESTEISE